MSKIGCLFCKHSDAIVEDNHGDLHTICSCRESEKFLTKVKIAFDRCDCEEMEMEGDE